MHTVKTAKQAPGGLALDALTGTLVEVKPIEVKQKNDGTGQFTAQNFKLQDREGNWMYGQALEYTDLTPWLNHEVIFVSTLHQKRLTGVLVNDRAKKDNPSVVYKNIDIRKSAVLHTPETYAAVMGAAPSPPPAIAPQTNGGARPPVPAPAPAPRYAAPPPRAQPAPTPPPQVAPEAQWATPPSPSPKPVPNGQKVGMAVKEAITLVGNTHTPEESEFWEDVFQYASEIIRVSMRLEEGELAPKIEAQAEDESELQPATAPFSQLGHDENNTPF
jgi:hypothetical protein